MVAATLSIKNYEPSHQGRFEALNRAWIEAYFEMEPIDTAVLQHPDRYIIDNGGAILMACYGDEIAGTVALKYIAPGIYEFTKMAVDEKFQGQGIGRALSHAAIAKARHMKALKIILYSNTKLKSALALYHKLGFKEVPLDGPYKRSDIKMELHLQ